MGADLRHLSRGLFMIAALGECDLLGFYRNSCSDGQVCASAFVEAHGFQPCESMSFAATGFSRCGAASKGNPALAEQWG